jgi:hypothetical protein
MQITEAQCGHFIGRSHMPTRWDERNARPQCSTCNQFLHGNIKVFELKLVNDLGKKTVEDLVIKSKGLSKFTSHERHEIYLNFSEKLKTLRKLKESQGWL